MISRKSLSVVLRESSQASLRAAAWKIDVKVEILVVERNSCGQVKLLKALVEMLYRNLFKRRCEFFLKLKPFCKIFIF